MDNFCNNRCRFIYQFPTPFLWGTQGGIHIDFIPILSSQMPWKVRDDDWAKFIQGTSQQRAYPKPGHSSQVPILQPIYTRLLNFQKMSISKRKTWRPPQKDLTFSRWSWSKLPFDNNNNYFLFSTLKAKASR